MKILKNLLLVLIFLVLGTVTAALIKTVITAQFGQKAGEEMAQEVTDLEQEIAHEGDIDQEDDNGIVIIERDDSTDGSLEAIDQEAADGSDAESLEMESQESSEPDNRIKIVCIGDSITRGDGVEDKSRHAYPARLQEILGDDYNVINLGVDGRCLLKSGELPYSDTGSYDKSIMENADIYIIMLGTNDTGIPTWDPKQFKKEYFEFVELYINLPSKPRVLLGLPPKAHVLPGETAPLFDISDDVLTNSVIPIVKECAERYDLTTLDLYNLTKDHPEWYKEGIHPNVEGYLQIAKFIGKVIES